MAYSNTNQLNDALLKAFRRAVEFAQNYRNLPRASDTFYVDRDDYIQAVPFYQRMIQLVPQMPDAHFLLGEALLELGQYTESENNFASIRLGDTSPNEHTLGYLMMLQGKR